ncbi:hypothetical protein HaLaN_20500 [Haematococcus lacustris]|uniref:Uncharacterized protein n=1 Tax=Haematococcus lacustris TaxID=44745 RepID=A0A699ZTE0_HAELA|nr:hypothetical protein HaLaN_20500 [Haematococcus lacustris]
MPAQVLAGGAGSLQALAVKHAGSEAALLLAMACNLTHPCPVLRRTPSLVLQHLPAADPLAASAWAGLLQAALGPGALDNAGGAALAPAHHH